MGSSLRFEAVRDLGVAEKLWKYLSPAQSLYDDWGFRFTFYKYDPVEICFVTAYDENHPVGLLPLQKNKEGFWEFFGGDYMEDNLLMLLPGVQISLERFLEHVPALPVRLEWMRSFSAQSVFPIVQDYKYVLPLSSYTSGGDFLEKAFDHEHRSKIKRRINRLQAEHQVEVFENRMSDLPQLFELNKKHFGVNSSFYQPHREDIFRELAAIFSLSMISIEVDGSLEAVSFSILYRGRYVGMNGGVNTDIDYLSKLLMLKKLDQAIAAGATLYDAQRGDYGWKKQFMFNEVPLYKHHATVPTVSRFYGFRPRTAGEMAVSS